MSVLLAYITITVVFTLGLCRSGADDPVGPE